MIICLTYLENNKEYKTVVLKVLFIIFLFFLCNIKGYGKDIKYKNYYFINDSLIIKSKFDKSFTKPMFKSLIYFYQTYISPTKGSTCKMYPSCSEYGKISIQKYGIIKGGLMIFDRLNRCGHDLNNYEKIIINGNYLNKDLPKEINPIKINLIK